MYCLFFASCSQGYIEELVEQNFTNYVDTVNREPILFGDYRNSLTEDPRLYEDIVDYEAAKAIFDEVGNLRLPTPAWLIKLLLSCTLFSPSRTADCYCIP